MMGCPDATKGLRNATSRRLATNASPTTPRRLRLNRRQTLRQYPPLLPPFPLGEDEGEGCALGVSSVAGSVIRHPRVNKRVADVRKQHPRQHERRGEELERHDGRIISMHHAFEE